MAYLEWYVTSYWNLDIYWNNIINSYPKKKILQMLCTKAKDDIPMQFILGLKIYHLLSFRILIVSSPVNVILQWL